MYSACNCFMKEMFWTVGEFYTRRRRKKGIGQVVKVDF